MQETPTASSRALIDVLYLLAIGVAGGIGSLITWFLNRQKVKPEILILEASAEKTRAEARRLDGETVNLAWDRIDELTEINFELRKQLDLCEIRGRHHEAQERRMLAIMELHGIKYSELDKPRED
jgi:hypothetical protein